MSLRAKPINATNSKVIKKTSNSLLNSQLKPTQTILSGQRTLPKIPTEIQIGNRNCKWNSEYTSIFWMKMTLEQAGVFLGRIYRINKAENDAGI
ncbi:hypothetical protein JTE90_013333 [Oedothorax gibbosus]|uniref:Uncharacterized protein n=1 Tax=Oedothorax gibbosus TaxID=931172 RepID=A0AAV6VG36_9ARAC|nr:hypothetical protein JTE90_013333 [Oedothorax gibbosus]